jgi:hypothetical protein
LLDERKHVQLAVSGVGRPPGCGSIHCPLVRRFYTRRPDGRFPSMVMDASPRYVSVALRPFFDLPDDFVA